LYYNHLNTGRPSGNIDLSHAPRDGEKFFSRYIDEQNSPQFPFGFGLTYTTFRYGPTQAEAQKVSAAQLNSQLQKSQSASASRGMLRLHADITNVGSHAGEETAQLYIRLEGTSTAQPVRALKAWQRVKLAPGETKSVSFELSPEALAIWSDQNKYAVEPARLTVWISSDSASGEGTTLQIAP